MGIASNPPEKGIACISMQGNVEGIFVWRLQANLCKKGPTQGLDANPLVLNLNFNFEKGLSWVLHVNPFGREFVWGFL